MNEIQQFMIQTNGCCLMMGLMYEIRGYFVCSCNRIGICIDLRLSYSLIL